MQNHINSLNLGGTQNYKKWQSPSGFDVLYENYFTKVIVNAEILISNVIKTWIIMTSARLEVLKL